MEKQAYSKAQTVRSNYYPTGVPYEIDPHPYDSLVDLIEQCIEDYRPFPAFDCMGKSILYDDLDRHSLNFAAYLQHELNIKPGSRIAIQMPNLLQYPIAMIGALRAGMVVVNTNPLYTPREMKHQLADSGAEVIVILANYAYNLEKILTKTSIKHIIITEVGDQLGGVKKMAVNTIVKHVKKMVPKYDLPSAVSFNTSLKRGSKHLFERVTMKSDDTAFLQYTGGTSGISKGAVLTHGNLVANIEQFSAWIGKLKTMEEIIITALPLYHILALTANCFTLMKYGGRNVLIPDPRDMKGFIKTLKKYPFTLFSGVNTLYNGLLNHPDIDTVDFSHLKICGAGGMAVQKSVAEKWKAKTGVPITEGYGLTETSPVLTFNIMIPGQERLGTIGLPIPSTQIMIADDDEAEVPVGEPGEIYAKGPQVMKEYWNQPTETKNAFTKDGWFKTGDIGTMDEDGYIRIVDRKKEMINVSGFNVYPNEIEGVISGHKKVKEVGAIGVPNDRTTEMVKVYVVKKDPSLTRVELFNYCKEHLTAYKVPKLIEFREELPKSNVGKILRRHLKEENLV